jgi:hypothetical protein
MHRVVRRLDGRGLGRPDRTTFWLVVELRGPLLYVAVDDRAVRPMLVERAVMAAATAAGYTWSRDGAALGWLERDTGKTIRPEILA